MLNAARIDQSAATLDLLARQCDTWLRSWRGNRKHETQLTALDTILSAALRGLSSQCSGIDVHRPAGEVYRECARLDHAVLWARRVFEYFRAKFDQRRDPVLRPTLEAADEIVWSCYKEPFETAAVADPSIRRGSAPLPFVDDLYAPEAFVRDEPPQGLRVPAGVEPVMRAAMDDFLRRLPIPVVALPSTFVGAPWWLSLLAHEVGHHVANDMIPGRLEQAFAATVSSAAESVDPAAGSRWRAFASEVFADSFSLGMMGPAATWALSELERSDDAGMLRPAPRYPAPAVRLALMALVEEGLEVPDLIPAGRVDAAAITVGEPALRNGRDMRAEARADLACARRVASAVRDTPVAAGKPLLTLCRWDAGIFRTNVRDWTAGLLGMKAIYAERSLEAARHLAAATALAFAAITADEDRERRRDGTLALAEHALELIPHTGEEGTRAAEARATWIGRNEADEFVALLLHPPDVPHAFI